jgi:hypothetical protein
MKSEKFKMGKNKVYPPFSEFPSFILVFGS